MTSTVYTVDVQLRMQDQLSAALRQSMQMLRSMDNALSMVRKTLDKGLGESAGRYRASVEQAAAAAKPLSEMRIPTDAVRSGTTAIDGLTKALARQAEMLPRLTEQMAGYAAALEKVAATAEKIPTHLPQPPTPPKNLGSTTPATPTGHGTRGDLVMPAIMAGAAGSEVTRAIAAAVKPAAEVQQALVQLGNQGFNQQQVVEALNKAKEVASKVPGTTIAENVGAISEMVSVFGTLEESIKMLEPVQKAGYILQKASGGKLSKDQVKESAFTASKFLEMRGATNNDEDFSRQLERLSKISEATGGRVDPQKMLQFMKYAGVAGQRMDERFLYGIVPSLIQENSSLRGGGSSVGTAFTSLSQAISAGKMSQSAVKMWSDLGLVDPSKIIKTKGGAVKGFEEGGITGYKTFEKDPYQWMKEFFLPALNKAGKTSDEDVASAIERMFGNRTAAKIMAQMALSKNMPRLDKDEANIEKTVGNNAYGNDINTFQANVDAFESRMNTLKVTLGDKILPVLTPAIGQINQILESLSKVIEAHPVLAQAAIIGGGVAALIAIVGGSIALLAVAMGPPGLIIAGAAVGIGAAITAVSYVMAKFPGTIQAVQSAFESLWEWLKSLPGRITALIGNIFGSAVTDGTKNLKDHEKERDKWLADDDAYQPSTRPPIVIPPAPTTVNQSTTLQVDGRDLASVANQYLLNDLQRASGTGDVSTGRGVPGYVSGTRPQGH